MVEAPAYVFFSLFMIFSPPGQNFFFFSIVAEVVLEPIPPNPPPILYFPFFFGEPFFGVLSSPLFRRRQTSLDVSFKQISKDRTNPYHFFL